MRSISARVLDAEGIDADADIIAVAQGRNGSPAKVSFLVGNFMEIKSVGRYDAVTAVAVIHHLPLESALDKARSLLAPRGTLVIIGCYRPATAANHVVELLAVPANMLMGLWRIRQREGARVAMSAPTAPIRTTLREAREAAARVLPGARIRRRLFWRYSLVWKAPAA